MELLTITAIKDDSSNTVYYMGIFNDITEHKIYEDRIKHQAYHDALTGLPNRLFFQDRLEQALAQARNNNENMAVMFLDLDNFKIINDSLGHAVGDLLLILVTERLKICLQPTDMVARLGGDEFTFIISGFTEESDVRKVVENIIDSFCQPFVLHEQEFYVTPSIGISLYPFNGSDIETLVKNADTAMYRAKEQGGNNYKFYKADMNSKTLNRLELETSLRRALEREEFTIYYQPQIDSHNYQVVAVEALLRWHHPIWGMISPEEFIPVAEQTGVAASADKLVDETGRF